MLASFHNLSSSWSTHFSHSRTVTLLRPSSKRSLTLGSLKRFYFFLKRKFLPEPKLPQWDSAHSDRAAILTQFCCADSLLQQMIYLSYLGFPNMPSVIVVLFQYSDLSTLPHPFLSTIQLVGIFHLVVGSFVST